MEVLCHLYQINYPYPEIGAFGSQVSCFRIESVLNNTAQAYIFLTLHFIHGPTLGPLICLAIIIISIPSLALL